MTQTETILAHLRTGMPLTQFDAMTMFGIQRLAARIHDLRQQGHDITDETVTVMNRQGALCRVSQYKLVRPAPRGTLFDVSVYGRID